MHWQASATADVLKRPWSEPGKLRALTSLLRLCGLLLHMLHATSHRIVSFAGAVPKQRSLG